MSYHSAAVCGWSAGWAEAARFPTSRRAGDRVEVPRAVLDRLTDLACYAA